nr:DUF2213 domain-containing protein [Klebsiella variicola]CEP28744.1 conserved hypothetical protein [Klebsiella variicola]
MPVQKVKGGWRWGNNGKVYPTKEEAEEQERAAYANGYTGDSSSEEKWITINGAHVKVDANGTVTQGASGRIPPKSTASPSDGIPAYVKNMKLGEKQSSSYRNWSDALKKPPSERFEAKQNAQVRELFREAETNKDAQSLMKKFLSGNPAAVREMSKRYANVKPDKLAQDKVIALDESSRRRIDENGYLHVTQTHLTKEQVAPYYGREIPGWEALELDPDRVYYGYRSGEELEKAKDTFNGMPLLIIHKQDSAHSPLKEERVGSIGTTPVWSPPYLDNALSVTDQSAINAINDESLKEISCGYFFEPDFTPGEFNGIPYDFVMRNLRGNHVALVKEGRAGPEVSVHDGMPSQLQKVQSMQLTKKQALAMGNLAAYLKPRLAQDAAPADLAKLVTSYKKPGNLVKAVVRQYGNQLAQDMEIEPEELAELMEAAEAVPESVVDNEADPMGQEDDTIFDEENPLESIKAILGGKVPDDILEKVAAVFARPTGDEDPEEKKEEKAEEKEEKKEAAMDANTIKQQARVEAQSHFRSLNEAGRAVRELVGELDVMAFDSAEDIYGHALKQKGVNIKNYDKAAYKGMVDIMAASKPATNPAPTFDSAAATSFDGQFAGLKNIKIR